MNVFIKPAPMTDDAGAPIARVVPDPDQRGRRLAASGEWKPLNAYWAARLRDGDVIEAEPPRLPSAKPAVDQPRARERGSDK